MIDLSTVLNSREHISLEVKAASGGLPGSLWSTYSSFANTYGGTIVLGIEEDRKTGKFIPAGVSNPQQMISDIWNTLYNKQKVSANIIKLNDIYEVDYEGKNLIVIEVPRADRAHRPVYIGNDLFRGSYRRSHEGDYHCSTEAVKSMLRDQVDSQDGRIIDSLLVSDLNQGSIRDYRNLFNNLRPDHVWSKIADEDFLVKIGAAVFSMEDSRVHPTFAGLVFFGDFISIINEAPEFFLDYREKIPGEMRWIDRVCSADSTWSGNIFSFYYMIIDRLTSDIKRPFKLDSKMQRVDDTRLHQSARECLANALIHADYFGRRGIVIEKQHQRIDFSNPGTFRIGIDEAVSGGTSDARNKRIFNMFSLLNVGERSGCGLCNVCHVWQESGLPSPEIKESLDPERVTVTLSLKHDNARKEADAASLTENEKLVLEALQADTTVGKLSEQTGISRRTVERALRSLKEKGRIARKGAANHGKWIVL